MEKSDLGEDRNLVGLVQMPIGFYDLLDRVTDQIGHHHDACPLVDEHTDKGMAQVMDANRLHFGCGDGM